MSGDLDSFLKGGTPAEEAAPAPLERAPEPASVKDRASSRRHLCQRSKLAKAAPDPSTTTPNRANPRRMEAIVPRTAYKRNGRAGKETGWSARKQGRGRAGHAGEAVGGRGRSRPQTPTPPRAMEPIDPVQ